MKQTMYKAIVENAMMAILITNTKGVIVEANKAACDLLGYAAEELIQINFSRLFEEDESILSAPATPAIYKDIKAKKKNGQPLWLSISSNEFMDDGNEFRCTILINNARSHSEHEALQKAKTELDRIVETSLDVICAVSADGIFLQVSAASEKIFGYKPSEMIGRSVMEFIYAEDHATTLGVIGEVMAGRHSDRNVNRYVKKDGSLVTIEWTARLDEKTRTRYGIARDITNQQASNDNLSRSEKKYKNIFENNPSPMIIWDFNDLQILDCNAEAIHQYGYSKEEFLSLKITDIRPPDEIPEFLKLIESEESYGPINRRSWRHRKKDGNYMNMDVTGHLLDYNGRRAALILMHDITEKLKAEEQKEFEKRDKEALINTTEDLIWSVSKDFKLIAANQAFFQSMKEQTGDMPQPGDSILYGEVFESALMNYWRESYSKALLGETFKNEVYVPASEHKSEAWFDISYHPIKKEEEIVGIACYSRDITDKKLADIKIRESEARLAAAQSVAKVGSWETDLHDGRVTWSAETYRIFGIAPKSAPFYHSDVLTMIHDDDREAVATAFTKAIDSTILNYIEHRIVLPDGAVKHVEERWQIIRNDQGEPLKALGTCQDITERKQAEEEIKNSEQTYKVLFEQSALPKWIYDLEHFHILDVNLAAIIHYGYSREEFLHMNLKDLRPEREIPKLLKTQKNTTQREGIIRFGLFTHLKKDGTEIQVEVSGSKITYKGKDCMVVTCNDVTQREITLDILMDRETKLENAQHIAKLGYWQISAETNVLFWSNEVYKIWELEEKIVPDLPLFISTVHPDDRELVLAEHYSAITGEKEMDVEHRIILPDGSIKWVHDKATIEKDIDGTIISLTGTVQDITPQKLMALSLEESNQRYKYVAKATSDTIWDWNLVTNNIYWNDGIETIFGYQKKEVDGPVDIWKANIHPEDVERVLRGIDKVIFDPLKLGVNWDDEYRFRKANGEYAYISDRGFIIRNQSGQPIRMVGAMQDITKRKQEEQHLKLLESVIINTNDAVLIIEEDFSDENKYKIIYVNQAFVKMTGYREAEVLGKIPSVLQGPKTDEAILNKVYDAMQKGEATDFTVINYKKDGTEFWNSVSLSPVQDSKGFITNWIAVERDVTDKMLSEIQLKELNEELQQNVRALAISNAELEQFAYVASHDLQEPLRMITSFVSQLDKKYGAVIDDKGKQYIAFAVDGARRMRQIILDLLEFSKVGRSEHISEDIDLNQLVNEVRVLFRRNIEVKSATITSDFLPTIRGHISPMRQVFQNLLSNALKYTKEGLPAKIHIGITETDHHFEFSIQDQGIGISQEYYQQIFVIFQRLHNKDEYSGTGMGLAITKKIIDNMGGRIWVESKEGQGSTFYFTVAKNSNF